MRICTARQMAEIDRETIAGGVPGEVLMERAGQALAEVALDFLATAVADDRGHGGCGCSHEFHDATGESAGGAAPGSVAIFCGKGNNGGDGLVMARMLAQNGCRVQVLLLAAGDELSDDARLNLDRLPPDVQVVVGSPDGCVDQAVDMLEDSDLLIDAIFGTGITPPLRDHTVDLIRTINDTGISCLAVDIPSGVSGDDGCVDPVAVAAEMTVTVGLPKRGLLLAPGRDFVGELEVVDIGFPESICRRHAPDHHLLTREDYLALLPPRLSSAHKYQCGNLLLVAGSRNFGGAAHLAGLGALRSGLGMLTVAVPGCLELAVRLGLPEALVAPLAETASGSIDDIRAEVWESLLDRKQAVVLGPGLGTDPATATWLATRIRALDLPLVVDAEALSATVRPGASPRFGTTEVVLTPHVGELSRMTGLDAAEIDQRRFELVPELASRWGCVLLLKGSPTLIGTPDERLFVNNSGDDALARGGSGDVLSGLIGGLLAQGASAVDAALLGAQVHGLAGTLAAQGQSTRSVLVRETAAAIGPVFESMEKEASSSAELRERIWPVTSNR